MTQEDQLPWGTQSGTGTEEKIERDRGHDTEKDRSRSDFDWERTSERRYDINPDLFGDEDGGQEPGGLFGDEDGGQEP